MTWMHLWVHCNHISTSLCAVSEHSTFAVCFMFFFFHNWRNQVALLSLPMLFLFLSHPLSHFVASFPHLQDIPCMVIGFYLIFHLIFTVEVKVDESPVQVTLCDTAGQDFLDPLRRLCYPDSDVFLLCFSVVKPDTFASIQDKWAPNFKKSHASIVLIGTQADLRTDPRIVSNLLVRIFFRFYSIRFIIFVFNYSVLQARNEKPVSKSDAWDYAASIGAKYIETSSRTNVSKRCPCIRTIVITQMATLVWVKINHIPYCRKM